MAGRFLFFAERKRRYASVVDDVAELVCVVVYALQKHVDNYSADVMIVVAAF